MGDPDEPWVQSDRLRQGREMPGTCSAMREDNLVSADSALATADIRGGLAVLQSFPIDQFETYQWENFERNLADQLAFLRNHLQQG
jgi:hypothetical protein